MPKLRTLRVYANPYAHVDHEGRPAGALPWDPVGHIAEQRGWVGATLKATKVGEYLDGSYAQGPLPVHDHEFVWSPEPVEIPETPYYLSALRSGELVAADEATARAAGRPFVDPTTVLDHAREGAVARHEANYGGSADALRGHDYGPRAAAAARAAADMKKGAV